ncbi:MAG: hypothetical protein WD801_03655 [Gemmatimonadaceae bacterium]
MLAKHKQPIEMYQRAQDFLGSIAPPQSAAYARHKESLDAVVAKLVEFSSERAGGQRQSRAEVMRNRTLRRELREKHMAPLAQVARALLGDVEGVERTLRVPSANLSTTKLLAEAEGMRKEAAALEQQFIENGRPADFLAAFDAVVSQLRRTQLGKAQGVGRSVGARTAITKVLLQARKTLAIIDVIIRESYRENADLLAKWKLAKRVQLVPGGSSPVPATGGTADENVGEGSIAA